MSASGRSDKDGTAGRMAKKLLEELGRPPEYLPRGPFSSLGLSMRTTGTKVAEGSCRGHEAANSS